MNFLNLIKLNSLLLEKNIITNNGMILNVSSLLGKYLLIKNQSYKKCLKNLTSV